MTERPGPGKPPDPSSGRLSLAGRLSAMIYLKCIEPLMVFMKSRIARWISESSLHTGVDACCGIGTQCRIIRSLCAAVSVTGIDLNRDFVQFASERQGTGWFVCGDAMKMPFKSSSLDFLIYSYALHDKSEPSRRAMMAEARRMLKNEGVLFLLDFEQPKQLVERAGFVFTSIIEFMAGWEHFRNGREFIRCDGLSGFVERNHLQMANYHRIPAGHTGLVAAVFKERDEDRKESGSGTVHATH